MTQVASEEAKKEAEGKKSVAAKPVTEPIARKAVEAQLSASQLGVSGEELPKVAYRLDDAAKYVENDILVVGGGESAIHAAVALSHAGRNRVTLSYRGDQFQRGPERNRLLIETAEREKKIRILRHCSVAAITASRLPLNATYKNAAKAMCMSPVGTNPA